MHNITQFLQSKLPVYLDMLHQMVLENSFTYNPEGVNRLGKLTGDYFTQLGFQPAFVQSTNPEFGRHLFLTRSPPQNPINKPNMTSPEATILNHAPIAMISHLDTVFSAEEEQKNNFNWRIEGDRIYGPGVVDIKGGTVLIFMVLDALQRYYSPIFEKIQWLVALDASEETMSDDFGKELLNRLPPDTVACLVFEGGTPNPTRLPLVTARKGRAAYKIRVDGRSAHAGNNHAQGANAIHEIARVIQQVESFTDYAKNLTFNVGTVKGGSVVNRVPHYAEATVEMRAFLPEVYQAGINRMLSLEGTGQVASKDGYTCQIKVEITSQTSFWPSNPHTERLYETWNQAATALEFQLSSEERGGLSDGNLLWDKFPTLDGLGPSGANAHCSESSVKIGNDGTPSIDKEQEYVLISSFIPKTLLNVEAIVKLVHSRT